MVNFTFNLLENLPLSEKLYSSVANFVNKNLLDREIFNPDLLSDAFNAMDSFWLKHRSNDWYSKSELRVITGSILESISDNNLSEKEVQKLVRYLVSRWDPRVAEQKEQSEELLSKVEDKAKTLVRVYRKLGKRAKPEKFTSMASKLLSHGVNEEGIFSALSDIFR
jgi:uncharacterized membrane-anchored protein YjiN (DUF445 family)